MERKVLVDRLAGLPALYGKAADLFTYSREQQVALGLITKDEYLTLVRATDIRSTADIARRDAEEAIGWSTEEMFALLPQEYQEAVNRHDVLSIYIKQEETVRNILIAITSRSLFGPSPIRESIGLDDLAGRVFASFKDTTNPLGTEFHQLKDVIARKERAGTKVQKIRRAHFDKVDAERKAAGVAARDAVTNKHPDLFQKELLIEQAIKERREEQLAPIRRKIKALLKAAVKERR